MEEQDLQTAGRQAEAEVSAVDGGAPVEVTPGAQDEAPEVAADADAGGTAEEPVAEGADPKSEVAAEEPAEEAVAEEAVAETAEEPVAEGADPKSEVAAEAPAEEAVAEEAVAETTEEAVAEGADPKSEVAEASDEAPEPVEMSSDELLGETLEDVVHDAEILTLKAVLEAIIYVLNEPMPAAQIAQALDRPLSEVEPVLRQLAEETARPDRGVFIREVAGGYQMATKPEHHEVLRTFVKNLKQPLKLSQAALETLAVIAYKQPITMPEILEIRGVQGGGVVKTLIDRKLITSAGRKNVVGKPTLYKTTKDFLTQFGLRDLNELPSLKEFEEITRQSIADEEIGGPEQGELLAPTNEDVLAPAGEVETRIETEPDGRAAGEGENNG